MENIKELADAIYKAKKIVVLTGAGISTESGIPDFKSTDKTWSYILPRSQAINIAHFNRAPKDFWEIYKETFETKLIGQYGPNDGHKFLAELEAMGKDVTICTQNVDGLHTKAGNKNVYEIHGSLMENSCPKCNAVYDLDYINSQSVPRCNRQKGNGDTCNFILKPGVVLFGESIRHYNESVKKTVDADLFMVLGSSLEVGPINELPSFAYHNLYRDRPLTMVIINKQSTLQDGFFKIKIEGSIGEVFNQVKKELDSR